MRYRALALTLALLSAAAPAPARSAAGGGSCVTSAAKPAQPPRFSLPPDAKITSKEMVFEVDVGSDGRARALQMDESSGDGAVDLSARQSLQAAAYDPPQTGCIAYSGGLRLAFQLPAQESGHPSPSPAALNPNCTPYILAFLTPAARDRKRTGTAVVAVELDAAGAQTAAPALRKGTGSPVLDQEALRIAHTGLYNFVRGSACAPQPFTYNLELTFQ
jgi:TonB family protein